MRSNIPWKTIAIMALIGVLLCAGAWWLENLFEKTDSDSGLRISEVMADGTDSDWIEIENTSDTAIQLYADL